MQWRACQIVSKFAEEPALLTELGKGKTPEKSAVGAVAKCLRRTLPAHDRAPYPEGSLATEQAEEGIGAAEPQAAKPANGDRALIQQAVWALDACAVDERCRQRMIEVGVPGLSWTCLSWAYGSL